MEIQRPLCDGSVLYVCNRNQAVIVEKRSTAAPSLSPGIKAQLFAVRMG